MTDKKTIQEALTEVQNNLTEAAKAKTDWTDESNYNTSETPKSSEPKPSAPKSSTNPKVETPKTTAAPIKKGPSGFKTFVRGGLLGAAATGAATYAANSPEIRAAAGKVVDWAKEKAGQAGSWVKDKAVDLETNLDKQTGSAAKSSPAPVLTSSAGRTGVGINKVMNRSSETPKTTTPEAPKETPKPTSFSQAFKTAREKATEFGKPSTGQFEFQGKKYQTNVAGEKYVPMSKQTKVDIGSTTTTSTDKPAPSPTTFSGVNRGPAVSTNTLNDTEAGQKKLETLNNLSKPESESGGKRKKMSEDTNPLIASFLALQEKNPSNMFEAAKKLSKKQDEKLDVVDDDKIDAKDFAALRAGKKHVDEAVLKDPKDPSVQGSGDVTMEPAKPAAPAAAPVHVKPSNPEKLKNLKDPRDPSVQGSGDVTYKEEVTFSQAEIDHINSFFLEASVAPTRPEVATGADSTSDKMSQNDVTGTSTESGKRKIKEETDAADETNMAKTQLKAMASKAKNLHSKLKTSKNLPAWVQSKLAVAKDGVTSVDDYMTHKEQVELEEGRPKKNPTPETTERDPRQHIQVIAGRAAAGNTLDFPHNDGSKSKITPAMGRKITSHLNGLKPADRQSAVNAMHASAEGLKV